jgi:hypothetical protein
MHDTFTHSRHQNTRDQDTIRDICVASTKNEHMEDEEYNSQYTITLNSFNIRST